MVAPGVPVQVTGPAGIDGELVSWLHTSPADFDRRRMVRGYRPASAGQPGLFTVPTPTMPRKSAPVRDELPGQLGMFGDDS